MKKGFTIAGISLLVILVLLMLLPFVFKGKLKGIVKTEANKMLNAKLEFNDLGLSFIRNFPNATISLDDLCITGVGEFEGDTLIYADQISATVNIKSFFGNSGYEVSKVNVSKGIVHAIILENEKVNWDIMKSEGKSESTESSGNFKLSLKKVTANDLSIFYDDYFSKINFYLQKADAELSGDMTADNTQIETNLSVDALTFIMDKIPYLSNVKTKADIRLNADFKNMKFTLSDNTIRLNEVQASLDGWMAMPPDKPYFDMDIRLNAPKTQFKDILSLLPAIYNKDFKDIKTSGEVVLEASAKGIMQGDTLPAFNLKMDVTNAMFQYPSLPQAVKNINLKANITNPGGSADNTVINVSGFHFEMAGNPFDMNLHMKTPVSDPDFSLSAVGHLDLGLVKQVYPLENMELNGKLDANLKIAARMSAIDKQQYDRINASGTLLVKDMLVKGKDIKQNIQVDRADLTFSPRFVELGNSLFKIGENDLTASGKLENFIPYMLKDETLRGNLVLSSNYMNLNDFMTESSGTSQADTSKMDIIVIPKNIDFNLVGSFKKVKFDNLDMENVSGSLIVKDGKVEMKNMKMNALGGTLGVNGHYDTSVNPKQPDMLMDLDISNVSFAKTFSTFVTVQKFAPVFEAINGTFSTNLHLQAPLGADFMPVLTSLVANGLLQSNNMEVSNVETLNLIASTLKNESLKDLKIKDLKLPFNINNGRVTTKPFDINFGAGKMNLSGSTGLDQTLDYVAKVDLPSQLTKGYLNKVNLKIGGTFKNPKISLDVADLAGQALDKLGGAVLGGNDSIPLSVKVNDEIDKQADAIRKQAQDAGALLISQSEIQGQKLVDEANKTKNPLAKMAAVAGAQAAAKQLKDEATKQAAKLNAEAEKQIQALSSQAKSGIQK